ncbi:tyrosine-type recombinase/integrase [Candidatus Desulfovibrio trichonymphae]|uniref:tyrosine-type recombinase/integrase n=1 Tax=Candidatus Desulfovibrio trichonymphae TaxID=1725232 RepID=UPI000BBACFCC|nr:tyrosine-type recombinase/integrase [Candidatus Desulfovibrio trichonymphae]GHU98244.1 hypothetical protein AGMMS50248_04520 [Deltaproteobacteria bacterium]
MAPYIFVRPGELRRAEWTEFDLEAAKWRIPAARMKMRELHIVPLARQVVDILKELQPFITCRSRYLFHQCGQNPLPKGGMGDRLRAISFSA